MRDAWCCYTVHMRTTLDIDPRVLAGARARVYAGHSRSLGEAVSQLALASLDAEAVTPTTTGALVFLPVAPDHVITDEMVAEAMLDE
jgi:hypothetical protein